MKWACVKCGRRTSNQSRRCSRCELRSRPRGNAFEPTRQRILARDGYRCQLRYDCCVGTATEVDHIVPFAHGGTEADNNLRAACGPCNRRRGAGANETGSPD